MHHPQCPGLGEVGKDGEGSREEPAPRGASPRPGAPPAPHSHLLPVSCPCRLFGFVARKQGSATDNACHLFAELDPNQPASAIVSFVSKVMLSAGQKR